MSIGNANTTLYIALIDGEPSAYGASFPDLPGCVAMGETLDEVTQSAAEALREWVEMAELHHEQVNAPSSLDRLICDLNVRAAIADGAVPAHILLVRAISRPVKANLSLDAGILAAIDNSAQRLKITRSALVERLAREGLRHLTV
jgi:predicted RNase H-like HicB family nuclease